MPRFDPTEFDRLLARLTPQELCQAEGLVADARKRAEAVLSSTRAPTFAPMPESGSRQMAGKCRTRRQGPEAPPPPLP